MGGDFRRRINLDQKSGEFSFFNPSNSSDDGECRRQGAELYREIGRRIRDSQT